MASEDLLNVVLLAGFVAYVGVEARARRKRRRLFEDLGARLGAAGFEHTASSCTGTVRGLAVDVRFHPPSKHDFEHTTIDVACPESAVVLHLRRQDAMEERDVARGEAVDVQTGHPAFDAAWIVEGAPAERVKHLLETPGIRARLLAFATLEAPVVAVDEGRVALSFRGAEVGKDAIAPERIELAVALAEAVIADARAPRAEGEIDPSKASYRSAARTDPRAAEGAQIAALERVRAAREMGQLRVATIALTAVLAPATLALGLVRGPSPIVLTSLMIVFSFLLSLALFSLAEKARSRARSIPYDPWMVRCAVGFWALQLSMLARALLLLW